MSEMERLREVAEAATQADWWPYFVPDQPGADFGEWIVDSNPTFICSTQIDGERGKVDAEHIATFDPPTVLALLDRLEAAEAKVARCEALVEPQWRSVPPDVLDSPETLEAFRAGRNWMIDALRAALSAPHPTDAPESHGDADEAARRQCDESCHEAGLGTCLKCDTGEWDLICDSCRFYAAQDGAS